MAYRTRTYIAADFDHDKDAVVILHKWNDSDHWSLHFKDAHELQQSYDSSLYCSIKASLKMRMDASKTFILIVGDHTNDITKGGCQYCASYNSWAKVCAKGYALDYRSYIKFECDKAVEAGIKIVILYNKTAVDKSLCPASVRNLGTHQRMYYLGTDGKYYWDYQGVKKAIEE